MRPVANPRWEYEVEMTKDAMIIRGEIPLCDMTALEALAKSRGFDLLDTGAAQSLGADIVMTNAEGSEKMRAGIKRLHAGLSKQDQWLHSTDTGISSRAIFSVMTGTKERMLDRWGFGYPLDPDDFGRCYRLLNLFPEWKPRMGEMAPISSEWRRLVENWSELNDLFEEESPSKSCPKLYARMHFLIYGKKL
jgi:hypothetical protein